MKISHFVAILPMMKPITIIQVNPNKSIVIVVYHITASFHKNSHNNMFSISDLNWQTLSNTF